MALTSKHLVLTALGIILVMFLYLERGVLGPFILAGVFAFILNPPINGLVRTLRLPKAIWIFVIYLLLFAVVGLVITVIGGRLLAEARQVTEGNSLDTTAAQTIDSLPSWNIYGVNVGLRTTAQELLASLRDAAAHYQRQAIPFFSGAAREAVGVLVFFLAGFYFLKDGHKFKAYLLSVFPERHHEDVHTIWSRVGVIMGNYLRGQLILIAIMSVASYLLLETLGVRYALILAVLTGFLEIIPYVGPITAGAIAVGTAFLTGQNRFGLDPGSLAITIAVGYFILRQMEDYFVMPHLYARLTKLHPLVVIFSVLAGGHIFGLIGLVLAVPIAASAKMILEYLLGKN